MSPEALEGLIESYLDTRNMRETSRACGIGYHRTRRALLRAGVAENTPTLTPEQRADVVEGYETLGSVQSAADQVGVSRWAAGRALKRAGVEVARGLTSPPLLDCPDLGLVPDSVLAEREGVSRQAIRQRRLRRGIPAWQGNKTCQGCGSAYQSTHPTECDKCIENEYKELVRSGDVHGEEGGA